MSLDDIWNEPVASPTKRAPVGDDSSPLKRPRQSLFLSDSDSDNERPPKRPPPPPRPDVDALFEDIDKDEGDDDLRYKPLAPALDVVKLAKEAEARHANTRPTGSSQTSGGGSKTGAAGDPTVDQPKNDGGKAKPDDGAKPGRRVLPKLDEERLVGPDGFPLLIKEIEGFKPKGKGNEHADLNRLMQIYQFWSHKMYPKTSFKDTINRVEKLCHSKRMQVRLSVWRDEFKGITKNTKSADDSDVIDLTEPTPIVTENDEDESDPRPQHKPLSPMRTGTVSRSENGPNALNMMDVDDDASLWDALDDPHALLEPAQSTPPSSAHGDDDKDMWDVVDEIMKGQGESEQTNTQIPGSGVNPTPSSSSTFTRDAPRPTNDDDWDDMYS